MNVLEELHNEGHQVEKVVGNLIYIKGHKVPHKGIPHHEAVEAINKVKKILLNLKPSITLERTLKRFNDQTFEILKPHLLALDEMTAAASTIQDHVMLFLTDLGTDADTNWMTSRIISHIFEYDQAYRFRIQDLANETSIQELTNKPRKEIKRLLNLNKERDAQNVNEKFEKVVHLLNVILLIPTYRNAFKHAITTRGIGSLQPDINDRYWMCMKSDYDYFGLSYGERQKLTQHADNQTT